VIARRSSDIRWRNCGVPAAQAADMLGIVRRTLADLEQIPGRCHMVHRASASLLEWGRTYLPRHFVLPPSRMHRWLEQELAELRERRGTRLNVIGPRGSAKSTVVTLAYVLRAALESWEPYIWIVSDTKHQAQIHLENVKAELVDNDRLAAAYPSVFGRGPVWRPDAVRLANGVGIEAVGTWQRVRGRRHRAERPTLIVCDDLQNDRHMESEPLREHTRLWFHGTLMNAGRKHTNIIHLGTALHRAALAMELARTASWQSKVFKAIESWPDRMDLWDEWERIYTDVERAAHRDEARAFYDEHRTLMDAGAVLLWREEEDLYTLMCRRVESGRAAFDREKQGTPINHELCEWPESYFGPHLWFDEWPPALRLKTMALDPSKGSDDARGDYSALVMLGVDAQGNLYVEADQARRPTPQIVTDCVDWHERFVPDAFGIEANQFQELLGAELEREFAARGRLAFRPWTISNQVNKRVRIRRLGPYLSARRLRFKARSHGTKLLIEQLRDFPIGDHDDGPDALEMAIRLAGQLVMGKGADDGLGDRLNVA